MSTARPGNQSGIFVKVFGLILIGAIAYNNTDIFSSMYKGDEPAFASASYVNTVAGPMDNQSFQCAGKTKCSQMQSCDEAKFYLKNCPGTITDADGDGIPCEDQWCGH